MAKKNTTAAPSVEGQKSKKNKKQRKAGVIKASMIALGFGLCASAIAGLSVALYYSTQTVKTHESYQRQMDAVYFRAYYDLIDGANDLGVNLKKLGVSASPKMQQSLLYEVWSAASLAEANLGMFESDGEGINRAQKFVNQLGDYCHALALRVADGKPLTQTERALLLKLGDVAEIYLGALERIGQDVDGGKLIVGEGGALESFDEAFSQFTEPDFAYPEMIYDGPFSDALEARKSVALVGEEIDVERGKELIADYFKGYEISDVQYMGEGAGDIATLNYAVTLDGDSAFVQLGKLGGKLIAFNTQATESAPASRQEASKSCAHAAIDFAESLGFEDMQVVWSSSADGECVVNLAPVQDGAVLYPDLIKVKLRESDMRPIGLDATHYAFNHRERELPAPVVSAEDAAKALSIQAVGEGRLALIPLRGTREVLTYEFECEQNGVYYVYIDALSGDEVNILYVIDSPDTGARSI